MNTDKFRTILIQARKAKGLSQADLGQSLGMPQSHISKLEAGLTEPRLSNFIDMARLLDLEPILIPKKLTPIIEALIRGESIDNNEPLWQPDEE